MEICERSSYMCGYHIYKDVWDAVIGEEFRCEREPNANRITAQQVYFEGENFHEFHKSVAIRESFILEIFLLQTC